MNRRKRKTGLRILLVTLAILPLMLWSLSGSAGRRLGSSESSEKSKSEADSRLADRALTLSPMLVPFKPPSADLNQVRNGGVGCDETVPNSCDDPADWVNGNAGASNAHYREGQSIPYRLVMKDLPLGDNTVVIEWDVKHSNANAIDFITHYQRVAESIQPCGPANHPEDIIPGCNPASFTTFDIPAPTGVNSPIPGLPESVFNALPVAQRRMTMYNGTIDSMLYTNPQGDLSLAQASTRITIEFTATSSTVVMSWGGHIARALDWGAGNSAGGISGSPYHTRLISLNGSGGNQDRSLSAAAVLGPQGCTLTNDNIDVCDLPTTTTHSAPAVVGQTYAFNLVNNGGSAFIVSSDTDPAGGTVSADVQTNGAGEYTITLTTTTDGGSTECSATVRVHGKPAAAAGADQEQCETSGFAFNMNASSTVPAGGTRTWSIDAANSSTTANIVNVGDEDPVITLAGVGTVRAVLTVTGAFCDNAVDTVDLTVSAAATVNAGADVTVCASSPAVTLAGSIGGSATSGSWSGGTDSGFNPDRNSLTATYTPTAAEIAAGSVVLTLNTDNPAGSCNAVSDSMTIFINANPTVDISLEEACLGSAHLHATATGTGPFIYSWKKNGVDVIQANSADLPLTGPGTYSVSVTDGNAPSCGSNTDTFVVCFTEGSLASAPAQPNLNAAIKPKSEPASLAARIAVFLYSTLGSVIL
jgi:hypothetical protein